MRQKKPDKLVPDPKKFKSFDVNLLLKPPTALSPAEKSILSNYQYNCVISQTPKIKSFLKPTSESFVSCEGQSKVKAMEEKNGEYKPNKESYQCSDEHPVPTKPLLHVNILEKDGIPTILSKAS